MMALGALTAKGWGGLLAGVATAGALSIPGAIGGESELLVTPSGVGGGLHKLAAAFTPLKAPERKDITPGALFNTRKGRRFVNQLMPTMLRNLDATAEILNYGYQIDLGLNRDEMGTPAWNKYVRLAYHGPRTHAETNEAVLRSLGVTSSRRRMDQAHITVLRDQQRYWERKWDHWAQKIAEAKVFGGDWVGIWAQAERRGVRITREMLDERMDQLKTDYLEREISRVSPRLKTAPHMRGAP